MRNVLDKPNTENQNTFYVQWRFHGNHAIYEIMWKNNTQPDGKKINI